MRLINPGPGEYCDRLSILALKISHGEDRGVSTDHFRKEWAAILPKLCAVSGTAFLETYTKLVVVNARLWQAEDRLREFRAAGGELEAVAQVAYQIQALNDARAGLIAGINKQTGNHVGEEKLVEEGK